MINQTELLREAVETLRGMVDANAAKWDMPHDEFCTEYMAWSKNRARAFLAKIDAANRPKLSAAPCSQCGYNGPGYYQPETHPCVKKTAPPADAALADGVTDVGKYDECLRSLVRQVALMMDDCTEHENGEITIDCDISQGFLRRIYDLLDALEDAGCNLTEPPAFTATAAAAALRARGAGAVPEGYSVVPTLILNRMKRAVDDAEKMATEGMHLSGAKVSVEISDIKSMLLAASKQQEG